MIRIDELEGRNNSPSNVEIFQFIQQLQFLKNIQGIVSLNLFKFAGQITSDILRFNSD